MGTGSTVLRVPVPISTGLCGREVLETCGRQYRRGRETAAEQTNLN